MTDRLDHRMRELTYRLIHMAPEAPPFPEEPLTTLKPQPTTRPRGPERGPRWAWIAAAAGAVAVALLVALPLFLLGGGTESPAASTTTSPPSTTVPPTTTLPPAPAADLPVTVYFLADHIGDPNLPGPHLVAVQRTVAVGGQGDLHDQLGAALVALFEGPTAADAALYPGISSSVPEGSELLGHTTDNTADTGRAVIDVNAAFESGGGSASVLSRLAQVVFTVTGLDGIDVVEFTIEGEPAAVFSAEGIVLDGPQSRDGYRDFQPLIFVETPLAGTSVQPPFSISGESNTFEAGLQYRIETADGTLVADGFTTATCGTGCWGEFDVIVDYALETTQPGFVVVFESSAQDGRPVNVSRIPVTLEAGAGSTEAVVTEAAAELPGGASLNGAVVVDPSLTITGVSNAASTLEIGGTPVPVENGRFTASVQLEPGVNQIAIIDGVDNPVYTVTYVPGGSVEFAFLTAVGGEHLEADYAQWLIGEEADAAAIEDGVIAAGEGVTNGYYIRNVNPQLRTHALGEDVTLVLPTPALGPVTMVPVPLAEWVALFQEDGSSWDVEAGDTPPVPEEPHFGYFGAGTADYGYWLTLDADGNVVQITGQYRP